MTLSDMSCGKKKKKKRGYFILLLALSAGFQKIMK
jgi:hypothetical protein